MGKLKDRKTRLIVETSATAFSNGKHREIILEFSSRTPDLIYYRLRGERTRIPCQVGKSYHEALDKASRKDKKAVRRVVKRGLLR